MTDFLNRTTDYFVNRVAPRLPGGRGTGDPARRAELERQALQEIQARISRGRPGPEEWGRGAPATEAPPPPDVDVAAPLRPVAVKVSLPIAPVVTRKRLPSRATKS